MPYISVQTSHISGAQQPHVPVSAYWAAQLWSPIKVLWSQALNFDSHFSLYSDNLANPSLSWVLSCVTVTVKYPSILPLTFCWEFWCQTKNIRLDMAKAESPCLLFLPNFRICYNPQKSSNLLCFSVSIVTFSFSLLPHCLIYTFLSF